MKTKRSVLIFLFSIITMVVVSFLFFAEVKAQTAEDFWALKTGNSWNYSGSSNLGFTWTWRDEVVGPDPNPLITLPGHTTYRVQGSAFGVPLEDHWYAISISEIREMQMGFDDDVLGPVIVRVPEGLLMGRNPIVVGDSWTDNPASATFNGAPIFLTAQNLVLGQAPVTDGSGTTHNAYGVRRILSAIVPGVGAVTDTVTKWFVPYLGVVKEETINSDSPGEIETEILTSATVTLPAGMTFLDVPFGHPARTFIEDIATFGITGGCTAGPPPNYCPDNSITRAQMAIFMEASLGVNLASLPACSGAVFNDVGPGSGDAVCRFIEDFSTQGITGGCGGGNFCPNAPVTRAQMAAFIEAALNAAPTTCVGTFIDVNTLTVGENFCRLIEDFSTRGITSGCGGGNFCPNAPVTRAQMAVFLVAAPPPLNP